MNGKDLLKKFSQRRFREVEIPYGQETVRFRIRSLTEQELQDYLAAVTATDGKMLPRRRQEQNARLIVLCVVGEDGKPLFGMADLPEIMQWDVAVTTRLVRECNAHLGLVTVEDAEKNSVQTSGAT